MRILSVLAVLLAVLAAACDEPVLSPGGPEIDGTWSGVASASTELPRTLVLVLQGETGDVSGTAALSAGNQTLDLEVEGTFLFPELDVTLSAEGFTPVRLTGQYRVHTPEVGERPRPDSIAASLSGSGFNGTPIVLRRAEEGAAALFR